MKLSLESIKNIEAWEGYHLPEYNPEQIAFNTMVKPEWLHFGSGNIFRIFAGSIAQKLIEQGDMETGIGTQFGKHGLVVIAQAAIMDLHHPIQLRIALRAGDQHHGLIGICLSLCGLTAGHGNSKGLVGGFLTGLLIHAIV